jgi:hypothetical protein
MAASLRLKPSFAIRHPFFKVSNKGTQLVDYSKKNKNQMRDRIRLWK